MSRIDEALRRASAGTATGIDTLPAAHALSSSLDASVLDRYAPGTGTSPRSIAPRAAPGLPDDAHGKSPTRIRVEGPFAGKVVIADRAPSVLVEQYRRMAGSLHELQHDRGFHSLTVTSAVPKEGKTLTAINLALTLSESYQRRVLLIDADLRRPSLHDAFGLQNERGLCAVLTSDASELAVHRLSPYLSVLPAGDRSANPITTLSSNRMHVLLRDAAATFDWILLDTPPVGIMPDAALVAGMTDGTLFVIGAGSTPHLLVARAMDELGRDRIIGAVLNRLDDENIPATDYYGEYGGSTSPTVARG